MKNRAKCKVCSSIIESYHRYDYVSCACGEISISGGLDALECYAKDFGNFIRVDDEGNEIMVKVVDSATPEEPKVRNLMTKEGLITMLDDQLKAWDNLPEKAMLTPVSHADLYSLMLLVLEIFKAK